MITRGLPGLLLVIMVGAASGALAKGETRAINDTLVAIMAEHFEGSPVSGATAAVILPDGTRHRVSWGTTADDPPQPMPESGRMLAGSAGKTIVGVVLLQLIEEGVLSLDDRLAKHLGGYEWYAGIPSAETITLRQLANHTSGLRDHVWFEAFQRELGERPGRAWEHTELARQLVGSEALFEPGAGWGYSDSNYVLLGLVIEVATGKPLYEHTRERVLTPLGLSGTSPSDRAHLPGLVAGTTALGETFGIGPVVAYDGTYAMNPQWEWAGGGFVTTSEDLAVLFHEIFTGDLLQPSSMDEVRDFVPAQLGPDSGYSVGMIRLMTEAGECHGHLGIMPGYLSHAVHIPATGCTIALQVNSDVPPARPQQAAAADAIARAAAALADPAPAGPRDGPGSAR